MPRPALKQKSASYRNARCLRSIKGTHTVTRFLNRDGLLDLHVTLALVEQQKVHRGSAAGQRAGVKVAIWPEAAQPKITLGRLN
jgi:hypothetical protein